MARQKTLRLLSWNLDSRIKVAPLQLEAIHELQPDIVALQEVTANTVRILRNGLANMGFSEFQVSFYLGPKEVGNHSANFVLKKIDDILMRRITKYMKGPRRYGQVIASRWPLKRQSASHFTLPWPERLLSVVVNSPWGVIETHTTHIPPGSSNGCRKIETLQGIFLRLARKSSRHRILCGDFNTPKEEKANGRIMTWAQVETKKGEIVTRESKGGKVWDSGERDILEGLAKYDLPDVFRKLHGFERQDFSWYWRGRGRRIGRRYDHVFASESLRPIECEYLHAPREEGLSDHSPIEVLFQPKRLRKK